jgi:drug/metabolite transporter (DMT)-like permease
VFATIGQLMMTQSYRIAPLAPMSAATAAGPLLTTILAALVLGQVPDTSGFFGMAVLLISAVVLPLINVRASAGRPPP